MAICGEDEERSVEEGEGSIGKAGVNLQHAEWEHEQLQIAWGNRELCGVECV
jgi:hypothetical protein